MPAERVRWRLTQRGCFWRSWTSSSLQDGEVKKQPVFDDQKVRQRGARAVELPRVLRQCDPAKCKMRRIGAGRGHIRARKLRVAARGGSGALVGSARWLRASRRGTQRAAGRSATHVARNAGPAARPPARAHANAGGLWMSLNVGTIVYYSRVSSIERPYGGRGGRPWPCHHPGG